MDHLVVALLVVLLLALSWIVSSQQLVQQVKGQAVESSLGLRPKCDPTLWIHVYKPDRLQVLVKCKFVSGIVMAIRGERDGDYHIALKPDKRYIGLLTPANTNLQGGNLVLEPICSHFPILQASAKDICGNFRQTLYIPSVGQHISVMGSYVLDHDHSDWAEIHPITTLKLIS